MDYFVEVPVGETIIGRDESCALRFNDSTVSRRHLKIVREGGRVYAEDVGSTNGTRVNDRSLTGREELEHGDALDVGAYALQVVIVEAAADDLMTRKVASLSEIGRIGRAHRVATTRARTGDYRALRLTDHGADRRMHERQQMELRLIYTSSELEIEASTRDVSVSGVYVCSHVLDPIGTRCELTILIDGGPALRVTGIVRRVVEHDGFGTEQTGLGIEFVDLGAGEREWLELAIARLGGTQRTDPAA